MTFEDRTTQAAARKPFYKRWWFITASLLLVLFLALLIFTPAQESAPTDSGDVAEEITLHPIGEPIEAPGVTLTVESVTRSDSIELYADGYKRGYMPNETLNADKGEYAIVKTDVKNTGQSPMDLTCGFAVRALLINTENQVYDPIDSLYRIIDNPECNDSLNPGFETQMTWVYQIPSDTELGVFGFTNPDVSYDDLEFVDIRESE